MSHTTKKRGYPSFLKTAGIAPKSAGIGSKFLSQHFFSRRFECGYRVARPVLALFKSTRKGIRPIPALLKALAQRAPILAFQKALVQVLNQYNLKGLYHRTPLVRWSLYRYKCLWGMRGKGQGSSLLPINKNKNHIKRKLKPKY